MVNTFLPYPSFSESARVLDDQRLRKQILEVLNILRALKDPIAENWHRQEKRPQRLAKARKLRVMRHAMPRVARAQIRGWRNHPIVRAWEGYEGSLYTYGYTCAKVYFERFEKHHALTALLSKGHVHYYGSPTGLMPPWLGTAEIHASHRSNLLRKDPGHYSQFWAGPDNLSYVWPE